VDHRRVANGVEVKAVATLAMAGPVSVDWCGYWQRGGGEGRLNFQTPIVVPPRPEEARDGRDF
jgi:hypothetical protein